jgi:hypothetical protein
MNLRLLFFPLALALAAFSLSQNLVAAAERPAIRFNKNFEAGALGKIEALGAGEYRCYVEGQYDEHGHNRQANWYYFQMLDVKERPITLTLTDFVGEYNGQPGACPMSPETIPVFSYDNQVWRHFPSMAWDDQKKEATLRFTPEQDVIWIAHVPPYPYSRVLRLLDDVSSAACARVEVVGKTAQGRDLHVVTVSTPEIADADKKTVWLIARQHAWETGTSHVLEGALRFITSESAVARRWRDKVIFKFVPTMDPDGCATGHVRFNSNGYDLNRHWDEVDLRTKDVLQRMPEIWYVKKALFAYLDSGGKIDLLLNMHNDEMPEYIESPVTDDAGERAFRQLFSLLTERTTFDPGSPLRLRARPDRTTNWLYQERKIPAAVMEQRIGTSKKLARQPTVPDRLEFGEALIQAMAEAVTR